MVRILPNAIRPWLMSRMIGGNVRYDRGSGACEGQTEGGDSDAVFLLEEGAILQ